MNKDRRKEISGIVEQLENLQGHIETLQSEEQDAFDAMPEGLQAGERGQAAEAAAEALQSAYDMVGDALASLEEAAA